MNDRKKNREDRGVDQVEYEASLVRGKVVVQEHRAATIVLPSPPPQSYIPPVPQVDRSANVWGIVALVAGILSLLILPIVLAPVAIIAGAVALSQRSSMGWWGIGLGGIALALVAYQLVQIQDALSNLAS
jgi:hypothetical protein